MKTSWMLQYKCKGTHIKSVCSNWSELIINFKIIAKPPKYNGYSSEQNLLRLKLLTTRIGGFNSFSHSRLKNITHKHFLSLLSSSLPPQHAALEGH